MAMRDTGVTRRQESLRVAGVPPRNQRYR